MRRASLLLLAAIAAVSGCNSRAGQPVQTSAYRGVDQGAVFAWAWGGAPGFEDEKPHRIVVLFDAEPGDADHRLLTCDSAKSDCKKFESFVDTGEKPGVDDLSLFGRFDTDIEKQDRLYLVAATRGPRLVTSEVISATASSRPTRFSPQEVRFDRTTQQLAWPRLPDSDLFVLAVIDESSNRQVTAIATRRKSWTYPELQGIVHYFHDPATVAELRPDRRYIAVLYALNKQNWATVVTNAVVKP